MAEGKDIVTLAAKHVGERYILGARAPMANSKWKGPWDCAEFTSWCLYQATGVLFGTEPQNDPVLADAYTGYWKAQALAAGTTIPVADAAVIAGAFVLRYPVPQKIGHIVISDGQGGTVEAQGAATGVVRGSLDNRRWDVGVLPPGVTYYRGTATIVVKPAPTGILRLTDPMMRGPEVKKAQTALVKLGYAPGRPDGVYGPQTASAVVQFQNDKGLVPDGEVGPATWKALKL